jgi:hypothetical protein
MLINAFRNGVTILLIKMYVIHRGHQYCMSLSTTVSDLSASLLDPRLCSEVPSTLACMTNGPLSSGCRIILLRLVEIPARYVYGPSFSLYGQHHKKL